MKKIFLFNLIIMLSHCLIHSQSKILVRESKTPYTIGVTLGNNDNISDGANFSMTIPKKATPTYLVNGALILRKSWEDEYGAFNAVETFLQWNKNTLIDKEQSNLSVGFIFTLSSLKSLPNFNIKEDQTLRFVPFTFIGNYYKDFILNQEALQFTSLFSFSQLEWRYIKEGPTKGHVPQEIKSKKLLVRPELGFEYDYRFNSDIPSFDGDFLRGFVNILCVYSYGKFNARLNYQYRYSFFNSTDFFDNNMHFAEIGVNYNFISKDKVNKVLPTIGLRYVNGQNPVEGFLDQSYLALNLSLKIN